MKTQIMGTMIRELPEDERPREKLINQGESYLSNAELLAILIGTGTMKSSSIEVAQKILSLEKSGIAYLTECTPQELCKIQGIGIAKAAQIIAAIELGKRIATRPKEKKLQIHDSQKVADLFIEDMRYLKKEFFKILLLNSKNEIIAIEEISVGNLNSSIVHPREVFSMVIKKSAASIILVHNHPSGNTTPSQNDIEVTNRLVEAGTLMGIQVIDHLIIGDGKYLSFREKLLI